MKRATVLLALLCAVLSPVAMPAGAMRSTPAATERLQAIEQSILTRLNATRVEHGLRPLVLSDGLQSAAVAHSRSMLDDGYFQHESKDGSPFFVRVKRFYQAAGYERWSVGENLLYSTASLDASKAIDAWLESPGHRRNMLTPGWREVGVSALHSSAAGGTFGGGPAWVVTMDFGLRTGVKPEPVDESVQRTLQAAAIKPRAKKRAPQSVQRILPLPVGATTK
jgi:uncharacterized protein YkwD